MTEFSYLNNAHPEYIEELYKDYLNDPKSVDSQWADFFRGYDFSNTSNGSYTNGSTPVQSNQDISIIKLIHAYRSRGHLISQTNPIRQRRQHKADLELGYFNLSEADFDTVFECASEIKLPPSTLAQIIDHLKQTYCHSIGAEFMHCTNEKLRQWMYEEMESCGNKPKFSNTLKHDILKKLGQAVNFENFLQTKYVGKKRFSLEGLEVLIPALDQAIRLAAQNNVEECILGMAHRGRLNVLVQVFQKTYEEVFSEFEEHIKPNVRHTGGDVKYHLGQSSNIVTPEGYDVHLSLVPNPSHLEAVSPVLQGIAQAKKNHRYNYDERRVLPIVIHGDAAISGQGVNYEVANFSKLDGYDNGGTLHIVTNNQVGFTANYKESRSSVYCTDLAKVTDSPVFHVNADDPEAVTHAIMMAVKIRQQFQCDVYVDILGYRKYGHNEGDEPRFTQPIMYKSLKKHKNVYELYLENLVSSNTITDQEAQQFIQAFKDDLQKQLDHIKENPIQKKPDMLSSHWKKYRVSKDEDFESSVKTGVKKSTLTSIFKSLLTLPKEFNVFPKTQKILDSRHELFFNKNIVDWAIAEQLAFGSLLTEKNHVRLSGQDSQRGTFSHRHAVIKDTETEEHYTPLSQLSKTQGDFNVYNSLLSEYAVLAFEFGYSLASPSSLVIWEAQFGDFANGAQIVIDQFITASETKWQKMSGVTLLLPHGYEGQGPEHSSARLERFLQACAENNMYVCNITTPANFFHVLRRQIHNPFRIPLVVMSPKSLFRHPKVISPVSDLSEGSFQEIIDDPNVTSGSKIRKVLCCTGKVYYDLVDQQTKEQSDIAIVRFEQLYPLPKKQLAEIRKKYSKADFVWVQEEPANMGAWGFILQHFQDWNFSVVAREASASPATGNSKLHALQQQDLISRALI
jgi:2-oxoglutarate dehydrogenase E1 component